MLTNDHERRICAKYSAYDETRHVHCNECPLSHAAHRNMPPLSCKAIMHYDRKKGEWEWDDIEEDKNRGQAE